MAAKKCAICGKPSGMYPLCNACFKLRDEGKVEKCDECGKWYIIENGCSCKDETNDIVPCQVCSDDSLDGKLCAECLEEKEKGNIKLCKDCGHYYRDYTRCECSFSEGEKRTHRKICPKCGRTYPAAYSCHRGCFSPTVDIAEHDKNYESAEETGAQEEIFEESTSKTVKEEKKCSKCGRPSGDFDICYICYRKKTEDDMKRDIETLIESEKDSGVDIRKKWPAKIRTQNGQYVRSHAECRIADWLAKNEITYEYERMVVSKKDKNRYLLCDFYLPRADVYIEYWGYKDKETYTKRRNEKVAIYDERGFIMLDMENEHLESLDDSLRQLLCEYYENL